MSAARGQGVLGQAELIERLGDVGGRLVGLARIDPNAPDAMDEARRTLAEMRAGDRLAYWYDFGDDWWHDIIVESLDRADPALTYPRCVNGRRAAPPEDSGGPWGFVELMRALSDEKHPEHEMYLDWMEQIGEVAYDPERFDLDATNEALSQLSAVALQRS